MEVATLGGGCFWCVETVYNLMQGVESAISGYAGGKTQNPTYKDCLLYTSPSPRDRTRSRMPSSA